MTDRPRLIPRGVFAPAQGTPKQPRLGSFPPIEQLYRLPGVLEWYFSCIASQGTIAVGAAITNVTAGAPSSLNVPGGSEGLIDYVQLGPNMMPTSGGAGGTWVAGIRFNQQFVPGWAFVGSLKATDGMGNWWTEARIFIPENTLVTLVKQSTGFGVGTQDIGGTLHGIIWPKKSRLNWQRLHAKDRG